MMIREVNWELTVSILNKLGYVNINTNEIGDGGNEIDVAPINTKNWMKFLEKNFNCELTHGGVNGCHRSGPAVVKGLFIFF